MVRSLPALTWFFYLATPMDWSEYAKIKVNDILTKFSDEYNLHAVTHNGWVYFEIVRGCYGIPQSGKVPKKLPCTRLNKAGNYEYETIPGLWRHTWCPIQLNLSLMILELNMWGENMSTNSAKSSKNMMKSQKTGKEKISKHWTGMELCTHAQLLHLPPLNPRTNLK